MTQQNNPRVVVWERKSEKLMLVLSLVFLVCLILPSARPISQSVERNLNAINYLIWGIFAFDYLAKFSIAEEKKFFVKGHLFELFIVVLPFARPLRLLRLIPVIGAFLKYSSKTLAGRMLQHASLVAALLSSVSAVLIYQAEKDLENSSIHSLSDSVWWAASTIATFGAGSLSPVSIWGKIIAFFLMLGSIAYAGVLTASVAAWFVKADEGKPRDEQLTLILKKLDAIEASYKSDKEKR